jgi:hypothetical protein
MTINAQAPEVLLSSRKQFPHHLSMHISQPEIPPRMMEGQPLMVKPEQV